MSWNTLKPFVKALVVIVLVAGSLWAMLPLQQKIHLGLDLQGGSRLLLQLKPTTNRALTPQDQQETVAVIDRRINGLGVAEPAISTVGSDKILVELPAVKDPAAAERVLKEVAVLEFKIVPVDVAAQAENYQALLKAPNLSAKDKAAAEKYLSQTAYEKSGDVVYAGNELKGAQAAYDQGNNPDINFQPSNGKKFLDLTTKNMGKPLGIFVDKRFISAPTINGPISDSGQITGSFTQQDAITLANELNAGALPVQTTIIENETVGPTLGAIDLQKSLYASMLGLALVLIFMIVVYRLPGFLADVALVIYVLIMLGILSLAHATLTLPGIAGFVLSIGMAVDANVLIFERIKEELWAGKSMRAAVRVGFQRAFSAVFDSHFTTIVGSGVLFMLGTGTVQGFAFTLFWGTVVSLFTAVFITRFFVDALVDNDVLTTPELYGVRKDDVGVFAKAGAH